MCFQMKFEHAVFGEKVYCDFIVEDKSSVAIKDLQEM